MTNHFVAGIDEAGYGPLLGPLVTSCMMLRAPPGTPAEGEEMWSLLSDCTRRPRERGMQQSDPHRILVGDSKRVHSPGRPHELERSALTLAAWAAGRSIARVEDLVESLHLELGDAPWEQNDCGRFPLSQRIALPAIALSPTHPGVTPVMVESRVVTARAFNRRLRDGNKAMAAWESIEGLLRQLWRRAGDGTLSLVIDRQGGRRHYGGLLETTFPQAAVWVIEETRARSVYRVVADGLAMEVAFCVGADATSWPCAAASILSKYVRELAMARLNGFFTRHAPELKATAGYYTDARRFLEATTALRARLGVDDGSFIRER